MDSKLLLALISIIAIAQSSICDTSVSAHTIRHPSDPEWQDYSSMAITTPEITMRDSTPLLTEATQTHRSKRDTESEQLATWTTVKTISYRRIIDVTQKLNDSIPGDVDSKSKPQWMRTIHTQTVAKDYYNKDSVIIAGGAGTHMDAPYHVYNQPARTIDEITAEEMTSRLVILDITNQTLANPDYQAQVSDLLTYEATYGRIKKGSLVVLRSGWSKYFYDEARYRNYGTDGLPHWPGFSADLSTFLTQNRTINGVGTDTISIDAGTNFWYSAHYTIAGANKYGIENLKLDDPTIPVHGATIVTARIKKEDAPEIWVSAFVYAL